MLPVSRLLDGTVRPADALRYGRSTAKLPAHLIHYSADKKPADIYRRSQLFHYLRDPEKLKGRCGACEFREVCGGSRARARACALTRDYLAEDPSCVHRPAASPA